MLGKVLGHHLRRAPELLRFLELLVLFFGHPLQAALPVADLEVAVPRLSHRDGVVREFGVDADLVHDGVVSESQLERGIVLHARPRVVDAEDARDLLLRLLLEAIQGRNAVHLLAPDRPRESFPRLQLAHLHSSTV